MSVADLDRLARDVRQGTGWRGSLLLLTIMALVVAGLLWAALTEIDDVTRAQGRVVPLRPVQVIQPSETGVLLSLHVAEGDLVEEGALLASLDPAPLTRQRDQEAERAASLGLRVHRLQAETAGIPLAFPPDLMDRNPTLARTETALYVARAAETDAEIAVLDRLRQQRRQDLAESETMLEAARLMRALVEDELAIIEPLVARQLEPERTVLALRRSLADAQAREASAGAALIRHRAAIDEVDDRIVALHSRNQTGALTDLAAASAELALTAPRLTALDDRIARFALHAPQRGIVNRISLTTPGALVQAGEPLIEIVPLDGALRVEAWVGPSDIAFLAPGQPVKLRLTAYDATRYGALDGEIIRVGADAIVPPGGEQPAFAVQIITDGALHDADDVKVAILPGMVADVDILTGRKSVLDYLTGPVLRLRDSAFRD